MGEIEKTSSNSARVEKTYQASTEDLRSALRRAVESLKNWEITNESQGGLEAVRTTGLFRFKDDVKVRVSDSSEGGSSLVCESASRVGKSDLGQNPRNIRELLGALEKELE